jgi:glycosyltransferase involved in cell wall biosynthesis
MPDDSGIAPLRVLVVAGNGIVGGMESTIAGLAERLPSTDFSLVALCPFEGPFTAQLRKHRIPVEICAMGEKLRWHSVQRAVSLAREHGVHVIHAHMGPAHVIAGLAGRAVRTPVLATVHSMHLSMLDLEVHRLAATHICVVSEAARAHALSVGVASARLSVIRNGVDADEFTPRPSGHHKDGDALTVGFVGRLSPEKNPALFLRTAALVHAAMPSARFVVIGDGPLRAELHAIARALRIVDVVTFAGECRGMPARYHALDVVLCTSWHEGTPLAVLEAMASGVPVVATDIGGNPELVASGVTGWLTPPGDEVSMAERTLSLLADEAMRARFGAAARTRVVQHFSVDDYVARTGALLNEVAYSAMKPRSPVVQPLYGAARGSVPATT